MAVQVKLRVNPSSTTRRLKSDVRQQAEVHQLRARAYELGARLSAESTKKKNASRKKSRDMKPASREVDLVVWHSPNQAPSVEDISVNVPGNVDLTKNPTVSNLMKKGPVDYWSECDADWLDVCIPVTLGRHTPSILVRLRSVRRCANFGTELQLLQDTNYRTAGDRKLQLDDAREAAREARARTRSDDKVNLVVWQQDLMLANVFELPILEGRVIDLKDNAQLRAILAENDDAPMVHFWDITRTSWIERNCDFYIDVPHGFHTMLMRLPDASYAPFLGVEIEALARPAISERDNKSDKGKGKETMRVRDEDIDIDDSEDDEAEVIDVDAYASEEEVIELSDSESETEDRAPEDVTDGLTALRSIAKGDDEWTY